MISGPLENTDILSRIVFQQTKFDGIVEQIHNEFFTNTHNEELKCLS